MSHSGHNAQTESQNQSSRDVQHLEKGLKSVSGKECGVRNGSKRSS